MELLHTLDRFNKTMKKPINFTIMFLFSMIFTAYLGYQLGCAF